MDEKPKKYAPIVLLLLFLNLLIFVFIIYQSYLAMISRLTTVSADSLSDVVIPSDWQKFVNSKYNFSFSYPKNLSIQELANSNTDPGKYSTYTLIQANSNTENPIKVATIDLILNSEQNTSALIQSRALSSCNADAPCAHASCPSINRQSTISGISNLNISEIYDNYLFQSMSSEKNDQGANCPETKQNKVVGPLYFVDTLSASHNQISTIEISTPFNESQEASISANILKLISQSFKFN